MIVFLCTAPCWCCCYIMYFMLTSPSQNVFMCKRQSGFLFGVSAAECQFYWIICFLEPRDSDKCMGVCVPLKSCMREWCACVCMCWLRQSIRIFFFPPESQNDFILSVNTSLCLQYSIKSEGDREHVTVEERGWKDQGYQVREKQIWKRITLSVT